MCAVSIENAVTTKRRAEKADRARDRAKRTKVRLVSSTFPLPADIPQQDQNDSGDEDDSDKEATTTAKSRRTLKRKGGAPEEEEESAVTKKVKVANQVKDSIRAADEVAQDDSAKANKLNVGSIIGKKRRKGKGN